jgi:hypothetical protein
MSTKIKALLFTALVYAMVLVNSALAMGFILEFGRK